MTIKEWTDYWMEVYDKPNVRRTTYEARRYIFQNHIIPGLGNIALTELTEDGLKTARMEKYSLESKCRL